MLMCWSGLVTLPAREHLSVEQLAQLCHCAVGFVSELIKCNYVQIQQYSTTVFVLFA